MREQLLRDFETNIKQNSYLVTQIYFKYLSGEDLKSLFEMPATYAKLTPATLREAARTYLNLDNYVQVTLLPEKKPSDNLIEEILRRLWPQPLVPQPAF